jgi:hypothetical protein
MLQRYLDELESNYLEVVLIPQRDFTNIGGMVRAVQSINTEWYRKFCEEHESNRRDRLRWSKFKTKVKRQDTIRGLKELISGKCETYYAKDLKNFLRHWAQIEAEREEAA